MMRFIEGAVEFIGKIANRHKYMTADEARDHLINRLRGNLKPSIELPRDANKVEQLRLKLVEYNDRLLFARRKQTDESVDSKLGFYGEIVDLSLKIDILRKVLETGHIHIFDFGVTVEELQTGSPERLPNQAVKIGREDLPEFRNAWGVIQGYCEDGGEHLLGGTGLPQIP